MQSRKLLQSLAIGCVLACTACSGDTPPAPVDEGPPEPPPPPIPPPGAHFSVVPISLQTIARITPIGSNNKIFPNPHTYWLTCDGEGVLPSGRPCHLERQQMRAPGNGVVMALDAQADGWLVIEGPPGLVLRFGHVTPAPGLAVGDTVTAGQVVATMHAEHGFDFDLRNNGVTHRFVRQERYNQHFANQQHPIAQFPEPLHSQLRSRVVVVDSDWFGSVSDDSAGTASGGWFRSEAPRDGSPFNFGNDHMLLWLGRYVERRATRIVVFGERPAGLQNQRVVVDPGAPVWTQITPASGTVALRLWNMNIEALPNFDWPAGTLLVRMPTDSTLRVEWFDTHEPVSEFTPAARLYVR